MSIILGDVKSRFFRRAKKQWEASGTIAMSGAMGQSALGASSSPSRALMQCAVGTFEEELPG